MSQRAEWLAQEAFFEGCAASGDLVFAILPVFSDQGHGLVFNRKTNDLFCTCELTKPCLHMEAFRLWALQADTSVFKPQKEVPGWVKTVGQHQRTQLAPPTDTSAQREAARDQRRFERLNRAANGFEDLEAWLLDTLRRGLATALSEDPDFYKNIAARLADASMRGMSRNFRMLEDISETQADWATQTLAVLADAALALHAFRNRDRLPENLIPDLETYIGIAIKKDRVRTEGTTQQDAWAVTAVSEQTVERQLRLRRTWLYGANSRKFALLLEYTHGGMDFLPEFPPGSVVEGSLIFYPSAFPQRALISESLKQIPGKTVKKLPGYEDLNQLTYQYAAALGTQPWLEQFPATLNRVRPYSQNNQAFLADTGNRALPLADEPETAWALIALSGGLPITVFGEWNGQYLRVLSAIARERFVRF